MSWAWGLPLTALTLAIYVTAVVGIALLLLRVREWLERRRAHVVSATLFAIGVIGAAGWVLAVLHGLEAALWAGAYLLLGAVDTLSDAMLFSLELDDNARRVRPDFVGPLEINGRSRSAQRNADVRH